MPYTTYRSLPLEALYDLLTISVIDLLAALDSKRQGGPEIEGLRKQIQVLIHLIGEKKDALYKN